MPKNKKSYKKSKKHKHQYGHNKNKLNIKEVTENEDNMIIGILKIEKDNEIRRVINSYERMKTKYPDRFNWQYIDA